MIFFPLIELYETKWIELRNTSGIFSESNWLPQLTTTGYRLALTSGLINIGIFLIWALLLILSMTTVSIIISISSVQNLNGRIKRQ
jgi:hypothetical protein